MEIDWDPALLAIQLLLIVLAVLVVVVALRIRRREAKNWIVVDGSNVLYWKNNQPDLETVKQVLNSLQKQGFHPVIWFDANVGYKISDRYYGAQILARKLGLPERQVIVADKGNPADPLLLDGASRLKAKIVTNDRFRDWVTEFPQVKEPTLFIRGHFDHGGLTLSGSEKRAA